MAVEVFITCFSLSITHVMKLICTTVEVFIVSSALSIVRVMNLIFKTMKAFMAFLGLLITHAMNSTISAGKYLYVLFQSVGNPRHETSSHSCRGFLWPSFICWHPMTWSSFVLVIVCSPVFIVYQQRASWMHHSRANLDPTSQIYMLDFLWFIDYAFHEIWNRCSKHHIIYWQRQVHILCTKALQDVSRRSPAFKTLPSSASLELASLSYPARVSATGSLRFLMESIASLVFLFA